ncbi:MAG: M14 family zinc carboxypeptidase, partial [Gammaproteobacteria bacterium]
MNTHSLLTLAEQSHYQQTGRTDEVERLCAAFAATWPDEVRSFEFGRSVEGRPMLALLASRSGALSAQSLRERNIPVLMIQAGIHPGESDGKDAGFIVLRGLLGDPKRSGVLEHIALLFVPAFNTDGHERVGRWNRPNQNGPEITGWRTTAQNLNLNRDYTKADAPEMRAMLRLIHEWDPLICADLHVTDGADFEPDISIQVEPINQGAESLRSSGLQLREALIAKLAARGSIPLPFYPDLVETDNPASGFVLTVYSPRFSTGYFPQRNRFTVLVETHSWKPYEHRVRVMGHSISGLAGLTAKHGGDWLQRARQADAEAAASLAGSDLVLDYKSSWREPARAGNTNLSAAAVSGAETIDFRGYAYTRLQSEISGGPVTVYDPATPQIWRVPYRNKVEPSVIVRAPGGGYVVPPAYAQDLGERLAAHGVELFSLPAVVKNLEVEVFRAAGASFSAAPFEGRMRVALEGEWQAERQEIAANALFVPLAQPLARLIVALFEPRAPDSFAAWGFFNACFEQKEQMEPYVLEQMARDVLAADPGV